MLIGAVHEYFELLDWSNLELCEAYAYITIRNNSYYGISSLCSTVKYYHWTKLADTSYTSSIHKYYRNFIVNNSIEFSNEFNNTDKNLYNFKYIYLKSTDFILIISYKHEELYQAIKNEYINNKSTNLIRIIGTIGNCKSYFLLYCILRLLADRIPISFINYGGKITYYWYSEDNDKLMRMIGTNLQEVFTNKAMDEFNSYLTIKSYANKENLNITQIVQNISKCERDLNYTRLIYFYDNKGRLPSLPESGFVITTNSADLALNLFIENLDKLYVSLIINYFLDGNNPKRRRNNINYNNVLLSNNYNHFKFDCIELETCCGHNLKLLKIALKWNNYSWLYSTYQLLFNSIATRELSKFTIELNNELLDSFAFHIYTFNNKNRKLYTFTHRRRSQLCLSNSNIEVINHSKHNRDIKYIDISDGHRHLLKSNLFNNTTDKSYANRFIYQAIVLRLSMAPIDQLYLQTKYDGILGTISYLYKIIRRYGIKLTNSIYVGGSANWIFLPNSIALKYYIDKIKAIKNEQNKYLQYKYYCNLALRSTFPTEETDTEFHTDYFKSEKKRRSSCGKSNYRSSYTQSTESFNSNTSTDDQDNIPINFDPDQDYIISFHVDNYGYKLLLYPSIRTKKILKDYLNDIIKDGIIQINYAYCKNNDILSDSSIKDCIIEPDIIIESAIDAKNYSKSVYKKLKQNEKKFLLQRNLKKCKLHKRSLYLVFHNHKQIVTSTNKLIFKLKAAFCCCSRC